MSALKSNMPGGTRLVALFAFAITACLFAWRANSFLIDHTSHRSDLSTEQLQIVNLIEPVLGKNAFRFASHVRDDGTQSFLLLVHARDAQFHLSPQTRQSVETILEAAAGYDATVDTLQIQPFVFTPVFSGGFTTVELAELGGLFLVGASILMILISSRGEQTVQPAQTSRPPANDAAVLRPVPMSDTRGREDSAGDIQRIARENPRETARILKSWMRSSEDDPS